MTDFVTSNTNQSVPATGQTLTLLSATGTGTSIPTVSTAGYVTGYVNTGYAAAKSYVLASDGVVSAGAVQMQGSNDGTNWYNSGSAITPGNGAGTFAILQTDVQPWKFMRARVSTTLVGAGNIVVTISV